MKIELNKTEVAEAIAEYLSQKVVTVGVDFIKAEDIDLRGGYGSDYAVWERREEDTYGE